MPNFALRTATVGIATMLLVACAGSSSSGDPQTTEPVIASAPVTEPSTTDATAVPETSPVTENPPGPDGTEADPAPDTTAAPPPQPEPLALDDISLLVDAIQSGADGSPLDIAQQVIGFPYEIPVPDTAEFHGVTARVRAVEGDNGDVLDHELAYAVVDTVADIDIDLDDNGAGSVEVIDLFDPVMTDLGFERKNSTASDPGDPGGPNSVNHVYVPTTTSAEINGVVGVPGNVFVWATENLEGRGESSQDALLTGRRVEANIETPASDGFAVPLLAAIADAFPAPEGAALASAQVRTIIRPDDSFTIDKGKVYLDLQIRWTVEGTFEDVVALFDGTDRLTDGAVLGAETSFFEPSEWEVTEGSMFSDGDWRRGVLLAARYDGTLQVDAPDEPGDLVVVTFDVDLDPVVPTLAPPE